MYRDSKWAVSAHGITKEYRRQGRKLRLRSKAGRPAAPKRALDSVDLQIRRGEMLAIVGLNGSGKSTLIRILATLTIPDFGTAEVFGRDVVKDSQEVRRHVNRVSVEAAFFKEMSPWENLAYAARLYGRGGSGTRDEAIAVLQKLGLPKSTIDRPMKSLSRGQQQKVAIARSLLTSPSLLLMDEPTTGLDPRSKREVQDFVRNMHGETNATVVVSTHDLAEAETLCSRVIVLDRGRVLADASPKELRSEFGDNGKASLEEVFLRLTGKTFEDDSEDQDDNHDTGAKAG